MAIEELKAQLESVRADLCPGAEGDFQLERPRNPEHGDLATNLALVLAGPLGRPPREIAERIVERLDPAAAGLAGAEIAGPGFINFRFSGALIEDQLASILEADAAFGRTAADAPVHYQVEFVSANPTGPLHVAHGRGAALGDAVASLLEWTGHRVFREFYVNDAGAQIDKLAESVEARWLQRQGQAANIPEGGYHGEYVTELAAEVDGAARAAGLDLATVARAERLRFLREHAVSALGEDQASSLRQFGVRFDAYYPESRLYREGRIQETLDELEERGLTYARDGAVWLRTTDYGDDKDRVLVKSDGSYTYFLPDLAYHRDKARRGFDRVIDVWGADHHGYVARMQAALKALGLGDLLEITIVQMVRILRGGKEVRLSKRAGEFVTLRELYGETGTDVARYFFLMRRGDAQMVFDLDLALDHSEKNPVYKVQYAHARMMSIFRKADDEDVAVEAADIDVGRLDTATEQELIKELARFPAVVRRAADARAPHAVCEYMESLAGAINSWYHAGNPSRNPELAVLVDDKELRRARLGLARAVRVVLRNGLTLLGLTAPERMEREDVE